MTKEKVISIIKETMKEFIDKEQIFADRTEFVLEINKALCSKIEEDEDELGEWKANLNFGKHLFEEMWICSKCNGQVNHRSNKCPHCGKGMVIKI